MSDRNSNPGDRSDVFRHASLRSTVNGPVAMFACHFHGHLESFADALVARTPDRVARQTSGAALRDADALADKLACFSADRECRDPRAAASQWSKWLFSRLIIATTVVQLATDQRLRCNWEDVDIVWHADATPHCFVGAADCFVAGHGTDLAALIDDLLCPLVDALTAYCRLSPRVFWSNAAVYYDWALGELARQDRVPASRLACARALLHDRRRPDGGFNPFAYAFKRCAPGARDGNDEAVTHCRRLCCMRDLDATWGLCANCPRALHYSPRTRIAAGR